MVIESYTKEFMVMCNLNESINYQRWVRKNKTDG